MKSFMSQNPASKATEMGWRALADIPGQVHPVTTAQDTAILKPANSETCPAGQEHL